MKDAAALVGDLRQASDDGESLRDFMRNCLHQFDGPAGLAKELKKLYDANGTPVSNKQRILSDIIKIWVTVEGPTGGETKEVDVESLEATLKQQLSELEEESK